MDERAFEHFYAHTARPLSAYLSRVLGDRSVADDVMQEAYLRLFRARLPSAAPEELRQVLFKIASRLVVDHFRRARRERLAARHARDDQEGAAGADAAARLDMERTFQQLRPRERVLLWLAYVEGADHREIADAIGVRAKSVRVLLFRARRRLAALVGATRARPGGG